MAESFEKKVVRIEKNDIISDLPRTITEIILQLLPIRDAVRTCILSRKWRQKWTTLPCLVFDHQFLNSIMKQVIHQDPKSQAYKFVSVINKVLLLHNGPILKFFLQIPNYQLETISDYINQWMYLLSRKGIKQLTLENVGTYSIKYNSHLVSGLELLELEKVDFTWCQSLLIFLPRSILQLGGFSYLTTIKLVALVHFGSFTCNCPVLESLTLEYCAGISHFNFQAPKLKCLLVRGPITNVIMPFRNMESVRTFSFSLIRRLDGLEETKTSNVVKVLGCLPRIEKFFAGKYFLQFLAAGGVPNKLLTPLHYMKELTFHGVNFADFPEVSCLLCLLRSAPRLSKLEISASQAFHTNVVSEAVAANFRIEDCVDCTLSQLQIVRFNCLSGFRTELELIKFLLANSPSLKTMFVHRNEAVKPNAALLMAEEMMQFCRASPKAEIRHLEHPVTFLM